MHWCTYVCVLVYVHRMCVSAYCGRHALVYVHTYVCVLEFTVVSMHWRVCVCVCVRVQCVEESQDLAENSNLLFFSSFEFTHIFLLVINTDETRSCVPFALSFPDSAH